MLIFYVFRIVISYILFLRYFLDTYASVKKITVFFFIRLFFYYYQSNIRNWLLIKRIGRSGCSTVLPTHVVIVYKTPL